MADSEPTSSSQPQKPATHAMAPLTRESRPMIVGAEDHIEAPFPLKMEGAVEKGFGRGSRELGIPTANLPEGSIHPLTSLNLTGIYYGFARIHPHNPFSPSASGYSTPAVNPTDPPRVPSSHAISLLPQMTAPYPSAPPSPAPGQEGILGTGLKGKKKLREADYDVWPMVMSVGWNPYYNNEKLTAEVHIMHQFPTDFYGHHMSVLVLGYIRPELNYVSKEALIDDINTDVKVALASLARPVYSAAAKDPFFVSKAEGEVEEEE